MKIKPVGKSYRINVDITPEQLAMFNDSLCPFEHDCQLCQLNDECYTGDTMEVVNETL